MNSEKEKCVESAEPKYSKRLSWLPNAFTMGNLSLGVLAVLYALEPAIKDLHTSAIVIICAMFLDGVDGVIARALKVTSRLGAELDSLADLTTFGIAPGILFYELLLKKIDFLKVSIPYITAKGTVFHGGIVIAMIYPITAAFRLARFNVSSSPNYFSGLPSPIAGLYVALITLFFEEDTLYEYSAIFIISFIIIAFLMVSTIRYSKPQVNLLDKIKSIKFLLFLLIVIVATIVFKQWIIFYLMILYIASGIILFFIHLIQEYRM
jgi:CDP-diacylglycerol--serine O-phosphatidyltransferase